MKKRLGISSKVSLSVPFGQRWSWRSARVALVYDWVDKWGGAEQLLLSLNRIFPGAPLFTSIYNQEKARWAQRFKVEASWLQKLPGPKEHERLFPLIPIAFESFDFSGFDVVISVSSAFAKGIITRPPTVHIDYCLSPTRFLWGERGMYEERVPVALRVLAKPVFGYLRYWDTIASGRPDVVVAISNYVAGEVKRFYGRKADGVIYPPVSGIPAVDNGTLTKKGYFLVVSRLVPYKRVDLAVIAFGKLGYPLWIVGTGSEENYLRRISGNNVRFFGEVSERMRERLYKGAVAVVVPQKEDLGLVALEAAACGTPVVAFSGGGSLETVKASVSGIFFPEQTPESLARRIKETNFANFSAIECRAQAAKFSFGEFERNWKDLLTKLAG